MAEPVSTTKGKDMKLSPTLAFKINANSTVALFAINRLKSVPNYQEQENLYEKQVIKVNWDFYRTPLFTVFRFRTEIDMCSTHHSSLLLMKSTNAQKNIGVPIIYPSIIQYFTSSQLAWCQPFIPYIIYIRFIMGQFI